MANPRLFKIKILWNKVYDVTIFANDISNKILSCNPNYIVDLVMWSKFGNSTISMKEVIITSHL